MSEPLPAHEADATAAARARLLFLLKFTAILSIVVTAGTVALLHLTGSELSLALVGSVAIGTIGTLMLAALLIGLSFFSHASGTDSEVDN